MSWHATLDIDYTLQADKTLAHFSHSGPLRILQSLYPEGHGICHNVIVHPPGGLVGGDTLDLKFRVSPGAHALVTTPGATRFYRSEAAPALQRAHLSLQAGARMEWLPLESICYSGCLADNRLTMALEPGAEMIGWDITALGLPHASQPFERGHFCQHIEVAGAGAAARARQAADGQPAGFGRSPLQRVAFFCRWQQAGAPPAPAGARLCARCDCRAFAAGDGRRHQPGRPGGRRQGACTRGGTCDGLAAAGLAGVAKALLEHGVTAAANLVHVINKAL
jgi:UreD urease accessory protein